MHVRAWGGSLVSGGLVPSRVLVLYLGNLYSLIIALLDKVNSMSSEVGGPSWAAAHVLTRTHTC